MKLNFSFSLRGPDRVAEEIATVLSKSRAIEFKSLFDIVHANLRSRDLARGGEEMLRLRAYEKLQNLVQAGIVKKEGKEYVGVRKALTAFFKTAAEFNARFAAGEHCRPPFKPGALQAKTLAPVEAGNGKPALAKSKTRVVKAEKPKLAAGKAKKAPAKVGARRRKVAARTR
jgi:hypothetical protein